MKNGKFIACSTNEGNIVLYKWGSFLDYVDKIQGHPNSIDAMIKLDENTVITGAEDGFARGISIYPHEITEVLG